MSWRSSLTDFLTFPFNSSTLVTASCRFLLYSVGYVLSLSLFMFDAQTGQIWLTGHYQASSCILCMWCLQMLPNVVLPAYVPWSVIALYSWFLLAENTTLKGRAQAMVTAEPSPAMTTQHCCSSVFVAMTKRNLGRLGYSLQLTVHHQGMYLQAGTTEDTACWFNHRLELS